MLRLVHLRLTGCYFQAVILVLSQLLRSSARDAALRGACAGEGRGAVWGAGGTPPAASDDKQVRTYRER